MLNSARYRFLSGLTRVSGALKPTTASAHCRLHHVRTASSESARVKVNSAESLESLRAFCSHSIASWSDDLDAVMLTIRRAQTPLMALYGALVTKVPKASRLAVRCDSYYQRCGRSSDQLDASSVKCVQIVSLRQCSTLDPSPVSKLNTPLDVRELYPPTCPFSRYPKDVF